MLFLKTGTLHLLTISGLHLNLIASSIFSFSAFHWKKTSPKYWITRITSLQFSGFTSIILILVYANLVEFSIPLARGSIMIIGYFLGNTFRIFRSSQDYYFFSMLLILLDPFNTLNGSFGLSFLATGVLFLNNTPVYCSKAKTSSLKAKLYSHIKTNIITSIIIFIGLLPINSYFFGKVYLISLLANILAIPIVTFLVMPWMFLATLLILCGINIGKYLILSIDNNLAILLKIFKILTKFSYLSLDLQIHNILELLLLMYISFAILLAGGWIHKAKYFILVLPLIFTYKQPIKYGGAIVNILDVGQGLGTVITLQNHVILYDVGPNNGVVANYLTKMNINNIDLLIISHTDQDHIGGLNMVATQNSIKQFYTNIPKYMAFGLSSNLCQENINWEMDGVKFQFLNTPLGSPPQYKSHNSFKNESSCVLKISGEGYSILYPGDIDTKTEKYLLSKHGALLTSNILVVPHHGSNSSSTDDFIDMVKPEYAIISAGYLNRYHHPSTKVIHRYLKRNIKLFNTAIDGSILINLTPNAYLNAKNPKNIQIDLIQKDLNFWNY